MAHVGVYNIDRFLDIGCGGGTCPVGAASARLEDIDVNPYGQYTAGQTFMNAPAGTYVTFGNTNLGAIRPFTGAGNLMGPGPDGTQAYMAPFFIGGGANDIEGAAGLFGSGGITPASTGFVGFFLPNHARQGFVGLGNSLGINLAADTGGVFLRPNNSIANSPNFHVDSNGTTLQINVNPLPTSPPSGTGIGYICFDTNGNLYTRTSSGCP
jgi:hypothetical protein